MGLINGTVKITRPPCLTNYLYKIYLYISHYLWLILQLD